MPLIDTSADHQHQVDVDHQRAEAEHLLGTEFDRLQAEIERKDNEIDEKDRALRDLLRQLDEQIEKAQQDAAQNSTIVEYLLESKHALSHLLKQGQDELKSTKEDKKTYKSALDVIVRNDSRAKKTFVKKTATLQRKIAIELKKVITLEQTLERKSSEYEDKIESLTLEKAQYEQRMTDDIKNLKQQIHLAHLANEDQRTQFEKKERNLHAQHTAKVAKMTQEIEQMKDEITHMKKCLKESTQLIGAPPPLVRSPNTLNKVFNFTETIFQKIININYFK